MELVSIPCIIMASINFYVAFYYIFIYLKRRKMLSHFCFSLICFSVGLYDVFCVGLYNSHSIEEGIFWQRLQLNMFVFISVFIIWFVSIFTGQKKNKIIKFYFFLYVFLFILSLFIGNEFTLSISKPAIKNITVLNLFKITYYEAEVGLLYITGIIFSITAYIYLMVLLFFHYKEKKDKKILLILFSQSSYFFGILNDFFVASRVYNFFYLSEYSFLVVILVMSYVLLNDFVNLHIEVEQNNINLEKKILERTNKIKKLNDELKYLVEIDPLTGIYNRRFFIEYFELEVKRAANEIKYNRLKPDKPSAMNFGLAIFDVDNFKRINDTFGHIIGDRVLIEIVNLVKRYIFTRDIFCRYGGEEFVLLFTRISSSGIIKALEKIRKGIERNPFYLDDTGNSYKITISIGAVTFDEVSETNNYNDILKIADERLILAKKSGKNKIIYKSNGN